MVEAEEGSRIEAGAATFRVAAITRGIANASHANGINSTQFCQVRISKPGTLFSVNRWSDIDVSQASSSVHFIGRAMVWISRTN
jgi:hypothetical protein